ncbi:cytochrome [Nesidiocoris tenuis]|uniref:Cytochrome n=1 Tax=Nesidiocoris tenuis TaxID=355587 RepID=A0ABN7BA58_9HEMI|nr:cytochrome [Nesidiocoris tenuis]
MEQLRQYSKEQVAKHNGDDGTYWLIIDGFVHDLTDFLEQHPGGEEILMSLAGGDGTECFEDVGHSYDAQKLCLKYRIGVIGEVSLAHAGNIQHVDAKQAGRGSPPGPGRGLNPAALPN